MRIRLALIAASGLVTSIAAAAPAQAAVVYSQAPTGSDLGILQNQAGGQNVLNAFTLSTATNVNGFDIYSSYRGAAVGQSVTIKIRDNNVAGQAGATNLYSFTTTLNSVSNNLLRVSFSDILLDAGNYYFGLSGTGSEIGENFYQNSSNPGLYLLSGDNNAGLHGEYATRFAVYGDTATPAVPEPATWAMMLVGFGVAGVALRRRQTVSAVRFA